MVYGLLVKSNRDEATALGEALCHLRAPSRIISELEDVAELFLDHQEPNLDSDVAVSHILYTHTGRHAMKVWGKSISLIHFMFVFY